VVIDLKKSSALDELEYSEQQSSSQHIELCFELMEITRETFEQIKLNFIWKCTATSTAVAVQ
jgi:hypothetical protein